MDMEETKHYFTGSVIAAAPDNGVYNSGNLLGAATKYIMKDNHSYVIEQVTCFGKLLFASGYYKVFDKNSIGIQLGTLGKDPDNPSNVQYFPANHVVNIPLGIKVGSGYALPSVVWTVPTYCEPDGAGTPIQTSASNLYIYFTFVLKRINPQY